MKTSSVLLETRTQRHMKTKGLGNLEIDIQCKSQRMVDIMLNPLVAGMWSNSGPCHGSERSPVGILLTSQAAGPQYRSVLEIYFREKKTYLNHKTSLFCCINAVFSAWI